MVGGSLPEYEQAPRLAVSHGRQELETNTQSDTDQSACSLFGFWASLGWLVLVCCERETLLTG
jgi:hypothetical protein